MTSKANEIRIQRIYDAPVQAVWDAWTDPAQVAQWWGPRGFTLTSHSKDLRVGGHWSYTMHGPDGTDYPNRTTYFEVEPLARLVYDHGANENQPPLFRVTVLFAEIDGKTHMDMTMALESAEAAVQTRHFIKAAGGNGTWDRLDEFLTKRLTDKERFVINRSFHAPLELVFDMWAKPEHVANWLAPAGHQMEYLRADISEGGSSFYKMTGPAVTLYGVIRYIEIRRPSRLVYAQQFMDENEHISRHPMIPVWPETMMTRVDFVDEGDGNTRVTVTWEPAPNTTPDEMNVFTSFRANMHHGWTGSLDKLEDLLSAR
jgi:uncharacterized protein YndB with AHSA1/START domain